MSSSSSSSDEKNQLLQKLSNLLKEHKFELVPSIYRILKDMITLLNVSEEQMDQIMKGAYVLISGDGGKFYDQWVTMHFEHSESVTSEAKIHECGRMGSSHCSVRPQFRLHGGTLVSLNDPKTKSSDFDLLIGIKTTKLKDCNTGSTFFQFERFNLKSIKNMTKHLLGGYLVHKQFRRKYNIGPFGSSKFVEENPLILVFSNNG